ncbi:hypothetical protein Vi05172_g8977 [Venturia inaequalis]|nr:hypothetical protein Vi05172_g8977 [Venturia inaequalis]
MLNDSPRSNAGIEIQISKPEAASIHPEDIISTTIESRAANIQTFKTNVMHRQTTDTGLTMPQNTNIDIAETNQPPINDSPANECPTVEAPGDVKLLAVDRPDVEHLATEFAHVQLAQNAALISEEKDSKTPTETVFSEDKNIKNPIWGPIKQILNQDFETLAMTYAPHGAEKAVVIGCKSGLHNRVVIIEYQPTTLQIKRCIRVPASGWKGRWSELDKFQMKRSIDVMVFVGKNTSMPIPEIIHWDVELDNAIQAPYSLMSFMEGQAPSSVWQGDVYEKLSLPLDDGPDGTNKEKGAYKEDQVTEDKATKDNSTSPLQKVPTINFLAGFNYTKVSPELEAKRQNIMKSLTSNIAQLRKFKFDSLGSITFPQGPDRPSKIVPSVFLPYGHGRQGNPDPKEFIRDRTFNRTHKFLHQRLDEYMDDICDQEDLEDEQENFFWGIEALLRLLVDCLPLYHHDIEPETFVIAPPDFGSQNLLCDDEGNITAILDWDTLDTKPGIVGWCTPPDWLCMDWWGEDRYCWPNRVSSPRELEKYRMDYERYLEEACGGDGSPDWKFTRRSAMFEVIVDAVSNRDPKDMTTVLKAVMGVFLPRLDIIELIKQIGNEGMGEEMVSFFVRGFEEVFATEGTSVSNDKERDGVLAALSLE